MILRIVMFALGTILFSSAALASPSEGKFRTIHDTDVGMDFSVGCRGPYDGPYFTGNGTETMWIFSAFCYMPKTRSEMWIQPPAEQVLFDGENSEEGCRRKSPRIIACP